MSRALARMPSKQQMLKTEIASLRAQVAAEIGRAHSSGISAMLGDISEEYATELKTLGGRVRIFDRMANDPQVRGQLRAIMMTMASSVRWKVEGGRSEIRDFVAANLLREGPRKFWCSSSWLDRLYELSGCLVYGFSMFAKARRVVDGRVIFSDLTWLHPRSIDEDGWVMDDQDNLLGVRRSFSDPTGRPHAREFIPVEDLFLATWDRRGPNWEGNAFIRPMYRPWKLGELAEKIDIIDLQNRGVGIPVAHLAATSGAKQRDTLLEILKSLRGGNKERAFILLQADEKVSFLTSEGQARSAQETLAHHRANIVKAAGTEYFEQGNTATGSRAGASALATGFFIEVNAVRVFFEDMINWGVGRMAGLVEDLVDTNFEVRSDKDYPRIVGSSVSPSEQLDNIPMMQDAVAKGMIPPNLKHANEMCRLLGWPELTPGEWAEAQAARSGPYRIGAGSPADGGPGRPSEAGPDDQGRDDREGRRFGLTEKKTPDSGGSRPRRSPAYPWLKSTPA